jgi:methylglyoxal synthase
MTKKRVALIAHDNLKQSMVDWARVNRDTLAQHELCATGTTGALIEREIKLPVHRYMSGPKGGDLQIGAKLAEGALDLLIFFWDPMSPHPHDVDVRALLRAAVVHDVPVACNRASADLLIRAFV